MAWKIHIGAPHNLRLIAFCLSCDASQGETQTWLQPGQISDCVQMAYEVLAGNTSGKTTLAHYLVKKLRPMGSAKVKKRQASRAAAALATRMTITICKI
jgi:hypothetical protein